MRRRPPAIAAVGATARPGVLGAIGDFAGRFALDTTRYQAPVLVASTDGDTREG